MEPKPCPRALAKQSVIWVASGSIDRPSLSSCPDSDTSGGGEYASHHGTKYIQHVLGHDLAMQELAAGNRFYGMLNYSFSSVLRTKI